MKTEKHHNGEWVEMQMWLSMLNQYIKDFNEDYKQGNLKSYLEGLKRLSDQIRSSVLAVNQDLISALDRGVGFLEHGPFLSPGQAGDLYRSLIDLQKYFIEISNEEK